MEMKELLLGVIALLGTTAFAADTTAIYKEVYIYGNAYQGTKGTNTDSIYNDTQVGGAYVTWDFSKLQTDTVVNKTYEKKQYTLNDTSYRDTTTYTSVNFGSMYEYDYTTCDGYGTLVLPNATYQNVVRIHVVKHNVNNTYNSGPKHFRDEFYYYSPLYSAPIVAVIKTSDYPYGINTVDDKAVQIYIRHFSDAITGTEGLQVAQLKCYPNPVVSQLQIVNPSPGGLISIVGMDGKVLVVVDATSAVETIDVSSFPKGIYIVKLSNELGVFKKRIVIE